MPRSGHTSVKSREGVSSRGRRVHGHEPSTPHQSEARRKRGRIQQRSLGRGKPGAPSGPAPLQNRPLLVSGERLASDYSAASREQRYTLLPVKQVPQGEKPSCLQNDPNKQATCTVTAQAACPAEHPFLACGSGSPECASVTI